MKYLKTYKDFINETRNSDVRSKLTMGNKLVNFLKKHNYQIGDNTECSDIYISFKTGDFTSIIPPIKLGGEENAYNSPQGFYCFDMNIIKYKLFGNLDITPSNFNLKYLNVPSKYLDYLCLGYDNTNAPGYDENNIIEIGNREYPRYMYVLKTKNNVLILDNNTSDEICDDLFIKYVNNYTQFFCKYRKKVYEFKTILDFKTNFKEIFKNNGIVENYITKLVKYTKSKEDKHISLYNTILNATKQKHKNNYYIKSTVVFNKLGIDGFTQRKPEEFIHERPTYQTVLFNAKCIQDLIKIDLKEGINNDDYIVANKNSDVVKTIKDGDLYIYDNIVYKHNKNDNIYKKKKYTITKITKDDNIIKIINDIQEGDYIKIIAIENILKNNEINYLDIIFNIKSIEYDDYKKCDIYHTKFGQATEKIKNICLINLDNNLIKIPFDLSVPLDMLPLFNKYSFNNYTYKYWDDNKTELEKKGLTIDDIRDVYLNDDKNDINYFAYYDKDVDYMFFYNLMYNIKHNKNEMLYGSNQDKVIFYLYRNNLNTPHIIFGL